ncbi:MAG: hypothetical protein HYX68_06360 [Planctomycetes bacterium]|nr:hypothetical protein [Planctomycetota bacterium]
MFRKYRVNVALSTVICLLAPPAFCTRLSGQTLPQRVLRETKEKWEAYDRLSLTLQEESKETQRVVGDPKGFGPAVHSEVKRDKAGKHLLFMTEGNDAKIGHTCYVVNERYGFELRRPNRERGWALATVYKNVDSEEFRRFVGNVLDDGNIRASGPFGLYQESIKRVFKDPNFKIIDAHEFQQNDLSFVKIHFTNKERPFKPKVFRPYLYESGWAVFCPEHYWRLCEYEATVQQFGPSQFTVRGTIDSHIDGKGFPIFSSSRVKWRGVSILDKKQYELEIVNKSEIEDRDPDPYEFTLTAFGLPEPPGMPAVRPRSRWYLWILTAAAVAIAVGWFFRRRMLRGAHAPAPEKGIEI